jgi:hypothetical protein
MAELLRNAELEALVLYSRGYIFCSTNRMNEALRDFNAAKQYENKLPGYLNGPIRMYTGVVRAKTAEAEQEKKEAILLLDSGGKIVRAHQRPESPYFIDFSLDRYHLDKSTALIAVGQMENAMKELKLVKGGFQNVRKQAYNDILQAQAHINVGNYAEATSLAEIALLAVQEIDSISYVERVEKIYQQLQDGPYKNSPDVGHLDYLLHYKPRKQSWANNGHKR